jgi:hypothetical protein
MYYKLSPSSDTRVIGRCNQQFEKAEYPVPVDHPNFIANFFLQKVDLRTVLAAYPKLNPYAKRTDLISGTWYSGSPKLLISDKLKKFFEKQNHQGLQFIPTHILHNKQKILNYWFTNPYSFDNSAIDFQKSSIYLTGIGGAILKQIKIDTEEAFNAYKNSLKIPESLLIGKLLLKNDVIKDLIILQWVNSGIGYYVSEKLKQEIEDAGCTGIEFTPAHLAYP